MHKTEQISSASGNPQRAQEPLQTKAKTKTDKPFRAVLFDTIIEQAAKKAYPNLR